MSVNRSGRYAEFFSFTLSESADVTIDLDSTDVPEVDTYMFLLNGSRTSGTVVEEDDDDGPAYNSRIGRRLSAGTYTVEATTYGRRATGAFQLSFVVAPVVTVDCSTVDLGTVSSGGREGRLGDWVQGCASQNRSGKYAKFYSFRVSGTLDVRIDLGSVDYPADDTYLYLISGSSKTGTVLESDDNGGDADNSRITRRLSAGTYVIEATTRLSARTGRFTVAVEVSKPVASTSADSVYLWQLVTLSVVAPASKPESTEGKRRRRSEEG